MDIKLNQLGFEVVGTLKHNVLLIKKTPVTPQSLAYCLKLDTTEQEIKLFKDCFPKINQNSFKTLQLPVAHEAGSLFANRVWWVLMDYYDGEPVKWDETNPEYVGGRSIGLDFVEILVGMLTDLKSVDTALFSEILPAVYAASWYVNLNQKLTDLVKNGVFPQSYQAKAVTMLTSGLSDEAKKDSILTNGDFQFRNFIKLPNSKIAVIDWTENPFNTPNIEPIEFAIMYQWTLMWANLAWQDAYTKKVMDTFGISKNRLRFALLVKSINQAHLWRGSPDLARLQVHHSIRALDGQI